MRHVWTVLYMANTVGGIGVGIYGRHRTHFRNDFTYNKYHFGVFVHIGSALGMASAVKMPTPWHLGSLFLVSIACTSLPAYQAGFREIKNQPDVETDTSLIRRAGLYVFVAAWAILFVKNRGSVPFLGPPRV
jgi:hypothetical protein